MKKYMETTFAAPVVLGIIPIVVILCFLCIVFGDAPTNYKYNISIILSIMLLISPTTLAATIILGRKHYHSAKGSAFYRNFPLIFGTLVQGATVIGLIVYLIMQLMDK